MQARSSSLSLYFVPANTDQPVCRQAGLLVGGSLQSKNQNTPGGFEVYIKFPRLHVCIGEDCECGIPETPAWISQSITQRTKCSICQKAFQTLVYGVGYTTRAHHYCQFMDRVSGGIYLFEIEGPTKPLQQRYQWLLEVYPGGRITHSEEESKVVQAEWVKGIRFLSLHCSLCHTPLEEGGLLGHYPNFLFPLCNDCSGSGYNVWGRFVFRDGLVLLQKDAL